MTTNKAIERVLERLDRLQDHLDSRFTSLDKSMDAPFALLEKDMLAIKMQVDVLHKSQQHELAKLIEYTFKTSWFFLAAFIFEAILFQRKAILQHNISSRAFNIR